MSDQWRNSGAEGIEAMDRWNEPRTHEGYIDEFGDERESRTPARDLLHTLATNAARHNREAIVPPTLIFDALREPSSSLDTGHSPPCPARKGEPCDDAVCGATGIRMLLEDIIAGKTNLVAASRPPVRIAGDGGPDTDVWTCSCGLTRPVTGSYGCADCGDGRPDSWERVR